MNETTADSNSNRIGNNNHNNAGDAEIQRFEAYLKVDPENSILWTNLGDLYHRRGQPDKAIVCFEKCLLLDKNNEIARGRLASVLITRHRFAEAETMMRGILERSGDRPPGDKAALLHNLGLALFYQSKFDQALEAFQNARDAGLRISKNLAYQVYSLHKKSATGEALELAQTWLEASPGPGTEGYISMLEMDHGDMDAATQRAAGVLALQPANPDANVVLGTWQMERQNVDRAADHYQRVVDAEPDNPRGWQGLGLVQLYRGNFPEAIRALEKALEVMPGYATNHLIIGWAKLADKDAVGAERAFRNAIEANRNFGEAHGGLASALVFQNRLDEARVEIKKALGLDPKGFGAVFAQSVSMQLAGKGRQGTKLLAKLLEQRPLPRSQPLIEHIRDYLKSQGHLYTHTPQDRKNISDPEKKEDV